ncbi:FixH family protein [Collimonas arenae]|uniref:FixH family protein n=1 Tax=Collimonas arenae TaxID=279058 RepID=UPI002FFD3B31
MAADAWPAIVVAAASYTCWLAFTRQDALVEDDYYKEGNAINQDLKRDEEAIRRGISGNLRYDPKTGLLSGVLLHVDGQADQAIAPETTPDLQLRLIHSTLPDKDITLFVRPDANGRFSVSLPQLDMARWQILIEDAHRDWRLHASWLWPQHTTVDLNPVAMKPADD